MKKGISLIVLVITIIVMIILAASVVISLSNSGVINRADYAVNETNTKLEMTKLELLQAEVLAEGHGKIGVTEYIDKLKEEDLIEESVLQLSSIATLVTTADGSKLLIKQLLDNKLDVQIITKNNCTHIDTEVKGATDTYSGELYCKVCETIIENGREGISHNAVIPAGGIYTTKSGTVYDAGDIFPETITVGDTYTFEDYTYKYGNYKKEHLVHNFSTNEIEKRYYWEESNSNSWGVDTISKTKQNYTDMLSVINGKKVTHAVHTFLNATNLINPPQLSINATRIGGAFSGCKSLKSMPWIPYNVTNMNSTFYDCKELENITRLSPVLTHFSSVFSGCTKLKMAPAIPLTTTYMSGTFIDCVNLEGVIEINADKLSSTSNVFKGTEKNIQITGVSPKLQILAETATNNNVTILK
ncbi:MAG: leucine-rich repeat protein [Clostridia bacterium]|nr:leucine-rich repeat protein [Clostridia bacterium]